MAEKAQELSEETTDILDFVSQVIEHGDYVLSQTPEMLPVLKQAGVVDSGGQGLMQIVKGCLEGLKGKEAVLGQGAEGTSPAVKGFPVHRQLILRRLILNSVTAQSLSLILHLNLRILTKRD